MRTASSGEEDVEVVDATELKGKDCFSKFPERHTSSGIKSKIHSEYFAAI